MILRGGFDSFVLDWRDVPQTGPVARSWACLSKPVANPARKGAFPAHSSRQVKGTHPPCYVCEGHSLRKGGGVVCAPYVLGGGAALFGAV